MLIDLTNKKITGNDAEKALDLAGITVNKNSIPYDKKPATITSGIRIGTPIVTSRNMKEPEMVVIADLISRVLNDINNNDAINRVREKVKALCKKFPVYEDIEI
jgi:glycine hydroxymethyltransferase